jgi:hypothetical protein
MRNPNGNVISYADASKVPGLENFPFGTSRRKASRSDSRIDRVVEMKAVGVTPEYLAGIRHAAPQLGALDSDDAVELRAVGVTPDYIRDLSAAGFRNLDKDTLVEARAVGVTGAYVRSMASAGIRGSIDDYVELRALGISPGDARKTKGAGSMSARKLLELSQGDWDPDEQPPEPPEPPDLDPNE